MRSLRRTAWSVGGLDAAGRGDLVGRDAGLGFGIEGEVDDAGDEDEAADGHGDGGHRQAAALVEHLACAAGAGPPLGLLHSVLLQILRAELVRVGVLPPRLRLRLAAASRHRNGDRISPDVGDSDNCWGREDILRETDCMDGTCEYGHWQCRHVSSWRLVTGHVALELRWIF
ncbi:hypothetical protein AXF42_Ash004565 [Apostasia shenzhenica]|uniref:Uncharacterized protein n=1 Tax=Apostasia shenzhenica TaxID=1088818 RepID=A0A2I0BH33_9ASPA|nr:hypothetical protein AXF42_Ash004565 [Apostasia shenzhenica]